MIDTNNLPSSTNKGWGFYGTMQDLAETAWPLAMFAIHRATGESLENVQAFLDSTHGRHFADEVRNGMRHELTLPQAIDSVVATWMLWRTGTLTRKRYDIPSGLPYLSAMVVYAGIHADLEER